MQSEVKRIDVELGEYAYPILMGKGLLRNILAFLQPITPISKIFIVSDEIVGRRYLPAINQSLTKAGWKHEAILLPAGEGTKSFVHLEQLVRFLVQHQVDRHSLILALGGGVIGDLAGFAAAITLRGIRFVQIPTSLLAQVDSSVGGKTAIDIPEGKNLVGAFHQPVSVLMDLEVLDSLPLRQRKAGYAEIVKYGLIDDSGFFDWLEERGSHVLTLDEEATIYAIERSCRNKARIVASDEKESGPRALLNLGHTFAHAFELEAGMGDRLLHGEAVAIGLHFAFRLSVELGLCPKEDLERILTHFRDLEMPIHPKEFEIAIDPDRIITHMQRDKKSQSGEIHFVLSHGIGRSFHGAKVAKADLVNFLVKMKAMES